MHRWNVVFRNDKMGFIKEFLVEPKNNGDYSDLHTYRAAVNIAINKLKDQGYDPDNFMIISVERRHPIR